METTRGERIRLGIFVFFTLALLFGTVAFLIGKQLLERNVPYYTRFAESVDGLNLGAKVKLNGIVVGQVTRIQVASDNLNEVVVWFEVQSEIPIKSGMEANLVGGISLTGLKTIELTGGSALDSDVERDGYVKAGTSSLKQLTGHAEAFAVKIEMIMNNLIDITSAQNSANLSAFLANLNRMSGRLDSVMLRNNKVLDSIPAAALLMVGRAAATFDELQKARLGEKTASTLASLDQKVTGLPLEKTLQGVQEATRSIEILSKRTDQTVYRNQEDISIAVRHLREAMENLNDVSRQVRENPSLLIRGEDKPQRTRR